MADTDASLSIGLDPAAFVKGMKDAQGAMKEGVEKLNAGFESISAIAETATKAIGIFGAVLAGGAMFKEAISTTLEFTGEVSGLSKKLGISTDEASKLNIALKLIGASSEDYIGAVSKLDKQLRTNESGLKAMGVQTRDSNGQLKNQQDIMQSAMAALMQYKEGTNRNLASQTMFGKGADEVTKMFKMNSTVMEEADRLQKAYNMTVGDEGITAMKSYKLSMAGVKLAGEAVMDAVGKAFLPLLVKLGEWFRGDGVTAVSGFIKGIEGFGEALEIVGDVIAEWWDYTKSVTDAVSEAIADAFSVSDIGLFEICLRALKLTLLAIEQVFQVVFGTIGAIIKVGANDIKIFADIVKAAFHLDWDGVKAAWQAGIEKNEKIVMESAERIAKKYKDIQTQGRAVFNGEKAEEKPKEVSSASHGGNKQFKEEKGGGGSDTRMQEWKNELERKKESSGQFFKDMTQEDMAFWEGQLSRVKGNGDKDVALRRQIQHEIYALKKQDAQQLRQLGDEDIAAKKKEAENGLAVQRENVRAQFELGKINEDQRLQAEKSLLEQEHQIAEAALEAKMKLYEQDRLAFKKLADEKAALDNAYALEVKKSDDNIAIAHKKSAEQWMSPMTNALEKSVTGMIQGTITARKALQNIYQSILGEFMTMIAKKTAAWLAGEAANTSSSTMGAAVRKMLGMQESAQAVSTKSTEAEAVVGANAAEGASGAASAVASVPYVGPILAIAAFASTLAMIMGAKGSIKSAAGGFDIPKMTNPLTQLHAEEMVLPAQYANAIRDMTANGSGSSGSSGDVHMHVHTQSTQDFKNFLKTNATTLTPALQRLARNCAR